MHVDDCFKFKRYDKKVIINQKNIRKIQSTKFRVKYHLSDYSQCCIVLFEAMPRK